MEHPDITKVNQDGFLGSQSEANHIENCAKCDNPLYRGEKVIEFDDHVFCDQDCLTEAFTDNPKSFGAETIELN